MATTWNPADRVNATLSNGNLTATPTGESLVRSPLSVTSGKYYFECSFATAGNSAGFGIANSSAVQGSIISGVSVAALINDGTIYINGTGSGVIGGGTGGGGGTFGVAFDMGAKLIWFRGSSGFWNATSGTANPATGVGGLSFSGLTGGSTTMFAYCGGTAVAAGAVTANFGDSAFVGAVPAGFLSFAATTWNPADATSNIQFSGGNLTVTCDIAGSTNGQVRATDRQIAGKFYWEVKVTVWQDPNLTGPGFSRGPGTLNLSTATAAQTGVCQVIRLGTIYLNGLPSGFSLGVRAANDTISIAVDGTARLAWFRVAPSGNWNGSATANPATGIGGVNTASIGGGGIPYHPFACLYGTGDSATANFGDTAFVGTVPAGFTSGFTAGTAFDTNMLTTQTAVEEWASGAPAMQLTQAVIEEWGSVATYSPYTTWSNSDKTAGITVTNSDLTAGGPASNAVRTVDRQVTGKFYWEVTLTTAVVGYGTGFANASAPLTGMYGVPLNAVIVYGSGSIWIDNVQQVPALGSMASGGYVLCFAVDLTNRLFWVKVTAGNWNNSVSANPATGVGGLDMSSVGGGAIPIYPAACFGSAASVTANFGAAAFSGTVPAGFTSGFPSGAVIPVNTIATQLAADTWAAPPAPAARLTNISIEQWAQVATINPQAVVTHIALDEWATVAAAVPPASTGGGPMISIII